MTTKIIQIDGMSGNDCVQEVKQALDGLDGVEVKSVAVGTAVLECDDEAACASACQAIDGAGYTAKAKDGQGGSQNAATKEATPSSKVGRPVDRNQPAPGSPPKGAKLPDERDTMPGNRPPGDGPTSARTTRGTGTGTGTGGSSRSNGPTDAGK